MFPVVEDVMKWTSGIRSRFPRCANRTSQSLIKKKPSKTKKWPLEKLLSKNE